MSYIFNHVKKIVTENLNYVKKKENGKDNSEV